MKQRKIGESFPTFNAFIISLALYIALLGFIVHNGQTDTPSALAIIAYNVRGHGNPEENKVKINTDGTLEITKTVLSTYNVYVEYYNDTEIT